MALEQGFGAVAVLTMIAGGFVWTGHAGMARPRSKHASATRLAMIGVKRVSCSASNVSSATKGCKLNGKPLPLEVCYRHPQRSACWATSRFYKRINKLSSRQDYDPISRVLAEVDSVGYRFLRRKHSVALVDATFQWTGRVLRPERLTFVVTYHGDKGLVANTFCVGRPKTTIYKNPEPSC